MAFRYFEGGGHLLRTGAALEERRFQVLIGGRWEAYPNESIGRVDEVEEVYAGRAYQVIDTQRAAISARGFNETDHPRDDAGQFTAGGSGAGGFTGKLKQAASAIAQKISDIINPWPRTSEAEMDAASETSRTWRSGEDKRALRDYTMDGYEDLNRAVGNAKGDLSKVDPGLLERVRMLDRATTFGLLKTRATLYRSVNAERLGGDLDSMVGKVITDHTFASTSTSPEIAERFARENKNRSIMRISTSAETRGAWLDGDTELTTHPRESEYLLPRGSKFKVTNVRKVAGRAIIDVELLPHGQ